LPALLNCRKVTCASDPTPPWKRHCDVRSTWHPVAVQRAQLGEPLLQAQPVQRRVGFEHDGRHVTVQRAHRLRRVVQSEQAECTARRVEGRARARCASARQQVRRSLDSDALSKDGKYQFVYIYATTPIKGSTGSPGAPIAVV
jgi:hypothetical protein